MSSRSRTWSDPRRRAARAGAVALLAALLAAGPSVARADTELPVTAVLSGGGQAAVVADLGAMPGNGGDRAATVTAGGTERPATLEPVLSGDSAVVLVVDNSAEGAASLPAWLSAAARFILETPARAEAVVIGAGGPVHAAGPPQRGPLEVVRTLDGVRAAGPRDVDAALELAVAQFPSAPPGRRLVMLYTTAPDAGGPSAQALGERLRAGGTILVVAGTAADDDYWAPAAEATGGFFAPAGDPVVVPALDQVQTTLRGRYLVRFAAPDELPAQTSIRVVSGGETFVGDATVPGRPAPGDGGEATRDLLLYAGAGLAALAVVAAAGLLLVRRMRKPDPEPEPQIDPEVARGRAVLAAPPAEVARGRASVPPPGESESA